MSKIHIKLPNGHEYDIDDPKDSISDADAYQMAASSDAPAEESPAPPASTGLGVLKTAGEVGAAGAMKAVNNVTDEASTYGSWALKHPIAAASGALGVTALVPKIVSGLNAAAPYVGGALGTAQRLASKFGPAGLAMGAEAGALSQLNSLESVTSLAKGMTPEARLQMSGFYRDHGQPDYADAIDSISNGKDIQLAAGTMKAHDIKLPADNVMNSSNPRDFQKLLIMQKLKEQ